MTDIKKQLCHQALQYANTLYAEQTGFLHYHYELPNSSLAIPIYENALFALLLLEKKEKEAFLRGQKLLKHLFAFQKGGFPIYLHKFPKVDFGLSIRMLPIFHALQIRFFSYFEEAFQKAFIKAKKEIEEYINQVYVEQQPGYLHELMVLCYRNANTPTNASLIMLFSQKDKWQLSPTNMKSQMLLAISMLHEIPSNLIEDLFAFYDAELDKPIHPYFYEMSYQGQLRPTIFSLIQQIYFHRKEVQTSHALLQVPLIADCFFEMKQMSSKLFESGIYDDCIWQCTKRKAAVVTSIEKNRDLPARKVNGFHPFCLHFKEKTLVLQEPNAKVKTDMQADKISLWIEMEKDLEAGEIFLPFYVENHPSLQCLTDGKTTTVFYPQQILTVCNEQFSFAFSFNCSHKLVGHIGFGRRPSEIDEKHVDRMIYFRALENLERPKMLIQLECIAKEALSSATAIT